MSIYTPALKAYRSCGFHNHTLAELRESSDLCRRAKLKEDDEHIAHVLNIFGSYTYRGITYNTSLALVGLDDPLDEVRNSSRGVSTMYLVDIDEKNRVWEFRIAIPKAFCFESEMCPREGSDPTAYFDFCKRLFNRTEIFAMEFLCCYKFFVEQVLETYQRERCEIWDPVRQKDLVDHPKVEEVEAMICTYEGISNKLDEFQKKYDKLEIDFSSIEPFLELHNGRNRKTMWPYYLEWITKHRVNPELVEKKTMEFISMNFLKEEFPY